MKEGIILATLWYRFKKWRNRPSFPVYRQEGGYRAWKDKNPPVQSSWANIFGVILGISVLIGVPVCGLGIYSTYRTAQAHKSVVQLPTATLIESTPEVTDQITDESTDEATSDVTAEATSDSLFTPTLTPFPLVTRSGPTPTLTPYPLFTDEATHDNIFNRYLEMAATGTASAGRPATQDVRPIVVTREVQVITQPPVVVVQTVIVQLPTARPFPTLDLTSAITNTPTLILTATISETPNCAPTPESTELATAEATDDLLPTRDCLLTDTPTITATPTDTLAALPTDTPTDFPSNTPTDTPTDVPTDTPTDTPTFTPTPTDTQTDTVTEVS